MDTLKAIYLLDKSMIGTFDVRDLNHKRLFIDFKSTPVDEGIDSHMTTSIDPPPPQQD